jgi:hypothetical protein
MAVAPSKASVGVSLADSRPGTSWHWSFREDRGRGRDRLDLSSAEILHPRASLFPLWSSRPSGRRAPHRDPTRSLALRARIGRSYPPHSRSILAESFGSRETPRRHAAGARSPSRRDPEGRVDHFTTIRASKRRMRWSPIRSPSAIRAPPPQSEGAVKEASSPSSTGRRRRWGADFAGSAALLRLDEIGERSRRRRGARVRDDPGGQGGRAAEIVLDLERILSGSPRDCGAATSSVSELLPASGASRSHRPTFAPGFSRLRSSSTPRGRALRHRDDSGLEPPATLKDGGAVREASRRADEIRSLAPTARLSRIETRSAAAPIGSLRSVSTRSSVITSR